MSNSSMDIKRRCVDIKVLVYDRTATLASGYEDCIDYPEPKVLVYDRTVTLASGYEDYSDYLEPKVLVYDTATTLAYEYNDYTECLTPSEIEELMTPLHKLVRHEEDLAKCRSLIDRGANVNAVCINGITPLFYACRYGNSEGVNLLLSYGTDVNHRCNSGESALLFCSENKCVEILLDAGATLAVASRLGRTPLMLAAGYGNVEMMQVLLQRGCDINAKDVYGETALFYTIMGTQCLEKFNLLVSYHCDLNVINNSGQSILHFACERVQVGPFMLEIIKYLLENGIKSDVPDIDGQTCLHNMFIYRSPRFKTVDNPKLLVLLKGCDNFDMKDSIGNTPLHVAVQNSGKKVFHSNFETLLKHRANILQVNNFGWTPMFYITNHIFSVNSKDKQAYSVDDFQKLLGFFISHGDHINRKDNDGYTMLHYAFMYGDWLSNLIPALINQGLDVNSGEGKGPTPLHVAMDLEVVLDRDFNDPCNGLGHLLKTQHLHVNARDNSGATPLHWAAWHGSEILISLLLENGADEKIKDNNGLIPMDVLYDLNHMNLLYLFSNKVNSQRNGLPHLKVDSAIGKISCYIDRENTVDAKRFLEVAIDTPGLGKVYDVGEAVEVRHEVQELIKDLQKEVAREDSVFKMSVQLAGSVADDTKCGLPDEFDFLVKLERMSNVCSFVEDESTPGHVFVMLREEYRGDKDLSKYFDKENKLMKLVVVNRVYAILRACIEKKHVLPRKNLKLLKTYTDFQQPGPSLNIRLKWMGSYYKDMHVSIDFVPILRPSVAWWPSMSECKSSSDRKKLLPEESQQIGCDILLLRTHADDVSYFKVSFSCLECHILRNATIQQHRGFLMAKTIRNIKAFSFHDNSLVSDCIPFGESTVDWAILEDLSTYLLKLAFLIVLEEIQDNDNLKCLSAVDVCHKIFDVLIKACGSNEGNMHLPLFFLPMVNYWHDESSLVSTWEKFVNTLTFVRDYFCRGS